MEARVTDELRSWLALVLVAAGWAAGVGLGDQLSLGGLEPLLPPLGAAAGYGLWRIIPAARRRGPPKYWRGRAYWD